MKISKNTFIIGASILAVASGVAGFYLLSNDEPETLGWMSSSWMYRKSISVSNSGSELTNEDVLVTIDTEALIDASKLQADCDDLRFTDSDGSTAIDYWVEGGCDTTTTRVWVQIPTLPSGGKTIYVYYGNTEATNAEETWSGVFITGTYGVGCPTGWSNDDYLDGRFPYGSSTAGDTGGAISHSHGPCSATTDTVSRDYYQAGSTSVAGEHNHNVTVSTGTANNVLPPYTNILFCDNDKYDPFTGMVTMFDDTLPDGWSFNTILNGKFSRGGDSGGGGSEYHDHTYDAGQTQTTSEHVNVGGSGFTAATTTHTHSWSSGTLPQATNMPPYIKVAWAYSSAATIIDEAIFMVTANPPLGWTAQSQYNGKFFLGATTDLGTTGGASTHTHTKEIPTGSASATVAAGYPGGAVTAGSGDAHSFTITTNEQSNLPPYYTVIVSKRKTSQSVTLGEESQNTPPNAPSTPYCEGLSNPTGILDTTPEFSAIFSDDNSSDTGNYYEIEVNTTSGFNGTSMWDTGKTAFGSPVTNGSRCPDISYAGTSLAAGTTYYWRIKFWDNQSVESESDWSATQNFTINAIPTSTLLLCENATDPVKVTDSTPEFSSIFTDVDSGDTGNYYEIEVMSIVHCFELPGAMLWDTGKTAIISPLISESRSIDYSYAGTSLTEGAQYCWRMRFWDNGDSQGSWSATATFIMSGPPSKPTNLKTDGKTNPTIILSPIPTFSVTYSDPNSDNSSAYEIEVNSASNFEGTVMWDTGKVSKTITSGTTGNIATYAGTPLSNSSTVYYWRIRFWDTDDKQGEWSNTAQFTDFYQSFRMKGMGLEGLKIN